MTHVYISRTPDRHILSVATSNDIAVCSWLASYSRGAITFHANEDLVSDEMWAVTDVRHEGALVGSIYRARLCDRADHL